MRPPDSIQVLLRVRCLREEAEERNLAEINDKLKAAQAKLAVLSAELERITATRIDEVQFVLPNTHHQALEARSRSLWRRCADLATEIEKLKEARAQQMAVYLAAHRQREVVESLKRRRDDVFEAERRLREQKLNEDLFLARFVAKSDTPIRAVIGAAAKE